MRRSSEGSISRHVLLGVLTAAFAVGIVRWASYDLQQPMLCDEAMHRERYRLAGPICLLTGEIFGNGHDLAMAAVAVPRDRSPLETRQICDELISTARAGDGYHCLGELAQQAGKESWPRARRLVATAIALHVIHGDVQGVGNDFALLSLTAFGVNRNDVALGMADEAVVYSKGDPSLEAWAQLRRGSALLRLNREGLAEAASREGANLARTDWDRAWAHDAVATVELNFDRCADAEFESLEIEELIADHDWDSLIVEVWNIRAWAWAACDDHPARSLVALAMLDAASSGSMDVLELHARLSTRRAVEARSVGSTAEAQRWLSYAEEYLNLAETRARSDASDAGWIPTIITNRGELAELQGKLDDAISFYQSAIRVADEQRAQAPGNAALQVLNRDPYIALFSLYIHEQRLLEALRTALAMNAASVFDSGKTRVVWEPEEVIKAWSQRDVIVVGAIERSVGDSTAYELRIDHGKLSGRAIGPARKLLERAEALFLDPDHHHDVARQLGASIIPIDDSKTTLEVLGMTDLRLPISPLRDANDNLVMRRRPLAYVMDLATDTPPSNATGRPVIIADAAGDLAQADEEAAAIAKIMGSRALLYRGKDATASRLIAAGSAELLHIAGHTSTLPEDRVLQLVDRALAPTDIFELKVAPKVAVLASCASAGALHDRSWDSFAAGFLAAGTTAVIASDRSVEDDTVNILMVDLYHQKTWPNDPARALAAVEIRASSSNDEDMRQGWSAFSVIMRPPYVKPQQVGIVGPATSALQP